MMLALLLVGCSDADPCGFTKYADQCEDGSVDEEPVEETEQEKSPAVNEPVVGSVLCFRPDAEVDEFFPTLRDTFAAIAWERWGWEVEFRDPMPPEAFAEKPFPLDVGDCDSRVVLGEPYDGNGTPGIAGHNRHDFRYSAAYVNGFSLITLDRERVEKAEILDLNENACEASEPWRYQLTALLTHELGHVLEVPHNDDPESPMGGPAARCWDPMPTEEDLAAALQPSR